MYTFKAAYVKDDYDILLYDDDTFTFEPGVTCLVGCNGSGKTTLLKQLKTQLKKEKVQVYEYSAINRHRDLIGQASLSHDVNFAIEALTTNYLSEGEKIKETLAQFAPELGQFVLSLKDNVGWILFDSIDSGFSIDNVVELRDFIDNVVIPDAKSRGTELYILYAANAFELIRDYDCIDVQTAKHLKFCDYEDYKDYVLASREVKESRISN